MVPGRGSDVPDPFVGIVSFVTVSVEADTDGSKPGAIVETGGGVMIEETPV